MKYLATFLLYSLIVGELHAVENIKIFSALGDPLIAEVQLLPDERQKGEFSIESKSESAYQFEVERVGERDALLLLSDQLIDQPILTLSLLSGEGSGKIRRQLTLFLDPVPSDSSSVYLRQLLNERNIALLQNGKMAVQQDESSRSWSSNLEQIFVPSEYSVLSRWMVFFLLGGLVALLLIWWWRSAEPVTETDLLHSGTKTAADEAEIWRDFKQGVEQIEREIHPPISGDRTA